MDKIERLLFEKQDPAFRDFTSKLIPSVPKESFVGVRTPELRKLVKLLLSDEDFIRYEKDSFMTKLPHKYYEENVIHGSLISCEKKDINKVFAELDKFLPYVDNWAVCDTLAPDIFKSYPVPALDKIKQWLKREHIYTVRFGVVNLMRYYLDANYTRDILDLALSVKCDDYYVNMALAWFYSVALIKQYEDTVKIIEAKCLNKFVQNKSIQKASESFRVSPETKLYLKSLKI